MKYILGVCACLFIATWQQEAPPKSAPSIQPTAEALMKAQAAADKALAKRDEASTEELKKMVEREIAKSAALPITTMTQDPLPLITPQDKLRDPKLEFTVGWVVIDGALYTRIGHTIVPASGGGASGCFSIPAENEAKIQRARVKFAEMNKAEPVKKD